MKAQICQDILLNGPTKEVEFANRCEKRLLTRNLKQDSFPTTEGVEEFLGIRLELRLVVGIDEELLTLQNIDRIVTLGIVCHKPVYKTQREIRGAL